jgi:hypothetical protein
LPAPPAVVADVGRRTDRIRFGYHPEFFVDADFAPWSNLREVRDELETGLTIPTEPDIILRVPGTPWCRSKRSFGSPNSSLAGKLARFGSVTRFLERYTCKPDAAHTLDRKWISQRPGKRILEQLCRNVVFAHWLASEREQLFVISLVMRKHLKSNRCSGSTWPETGFQFRSYLRNKTLNLAAAFDLP